MFFAADIIQTLMDDFCCYNMPCFYSQELFPPSHLCVIVTVDNVITVSVIWAL